MFTRPCPQCGKIFEYTKVGNMRRAEALRSLCKACVGERRSEGYDLNRPCPQCGKALSYSSPDKMRRAERGASLCGACAHKKRTRPVQIGGFVRTCPKCGKKLYYKRWDVRRNAEQAGKRCASCTLRGRIHSRETRRKMSDALKGRVLSAEHCRKLSIAKGGSGVAMQVRPSSIQTAQRLCKKLANNICQICGASNKIMYGHHVIHYVVASKLGADQRNLICLCKSCHNKAHETNRQS